MAAMYSLYLSVCCLSFWFVRVDNLRYLLSSVSDAGRWPVVVYKGWVRGFLTVVVPVALVTSYPVLALMGNLSWELGVQAAGVGVGSLVVSRWLWRKALGFYSSGGG
jgi:ABC-2 type transport system permease protein